MDSNRKFDEVALIAKMRGAGFQDRHEGTRYIREALKFYVPGIGVTKEIYPAVAKRMGTTPAAVEKAMRTAIAAAHEQSWVGSTSRSVTGWGEYPHAVGEVLARLNTWMEYGV